MSNKRLNIASGFFTLAAALKPEAPRTVISDQRWTST
jgi:hypothetical protein